VLEGFVAAILLLVGAFPETGASAPAAAAFPLDIYFDLKQALANTTNWIWFVLAVAVGLLVRASALVGTFWLLEEQPGPLLSALLSGVRVAGIAVVALFIPAGLFFSAVAVRYAPFGWIAAAGGLIVSLLVIRAALQLDVGGGRPRGHGVPEVPGFLAYAYLVAGLAAAMTVLARLGLWAPALLLFFSGPIHAVFLVGWREHTRAGTYPGGGAISLAATGLVVVLIGGAAIYDRELAEHPPVGRPTAEGMLLILGGVDSTAKTGALADLDPRDVGFLRRRAVLLSYRPDAQPYRQQDTRGDLETIARAVARQIRHIESPRALVGHSQAALILDRILRLGLAAPDASVEFAASPPYSPFLDVPLPDRSGEGKPGGDFTRGLAKVVDLIGGELHIDVPASPVRLNEVIVQTGPIPRLAVWPIADSVWLDGDWRRSGETNVVAFTDHVGVTNNGRALTLARRFLSGESVSDDESSWRGFFAAVTRYAFEPWRPR
jgi:hypothetical protein